MSDQESTLAAMEQRLVSERGQLRDFNAGVEGYVPEHKLAVAALAVGVKGVEVSVDDSNAYSAEAKQWGAALAALAVVYAIAHMDEVTDVAKVLNEADAHVRSLKAGIEQTASSIETQRVFVQRAHEDLDRVAQREAALQQQLGAL